MRRGAWALAALLCACACARPADNTVGQLSVLHLPSPDSLVRTASGRLFDSRTGEFTETLTATAGKASLTRTTTGVFDLEATRARMTTRFSASGAGAAAVLGRPVDLGSLDSELVRDGTSAYLTKPSWTGALQGRWMRYEGQWLGGLARQWSDVLNPPWDTDYDMADPSPVPLLALPQKMTGTGGFLDGSPDVGRYRINVPLAEARPLVGASTHIGGDVAGTAPTGSGSADEELPVEVEVTGKGTLASVSLDATRLVSRVLGTSGISYVYRLTLRKLGEPVQVAVPPAGAQVPGGVSVQDLRTGTCLGPDAAARRHLFFTPVSCAGPHGFEVYARVVLGTEADGFPGGRQIAQRAGQRCAEEFARYVGVPASGSAMTYWTVPPGEGLWLQGGREAPCVLDPRAVVAGSQRGSDR